MCEPTTILAGAALVGSAMTAYSSYQQGQFANEMGDRNAKVAELKGQEAQQLGSNAEDQQRTRTRQVLGAQRAAAGASGLQTDSGSFGDVQTDTAKFGELDALTARSNATKAAWGYDIEAADSRAQGAMAAKSGALSGFGTILSGAAQAYGMASTPKLTGIARLTAYRSGNLKLS